MSENFFKNILGLDQFLNTFFFLLLSIIPISILIGPAFSLLNFILIALVFLFFFNYSVNSDLFKKKSIIVMLIIYFYLMLNSLISINAESGLFRNFGFIRYIALFILINYLFSLNKYFDKIFRFWFIIFSIVLFDVIFEFYLGQNILGYESSDKKRIVSFFRDEHIVGTFLNGLFFILIGFLFYNFEKKNKFQKILIFSFLVLVVFAMILTGERSNTLKLLIGLSIFFYFNYKIRLLHKSLFVIATLIIFFFSFNHFTEIKHRYQNDLIEKLQNKETRENYIYFKLYRSGIEVFKNYPIFGVGNKNYRIETCKKNENTKYFCNTHPHQIYIELLSEHGVVGTIILLSSILYLLFKNFKLMLNSKNMIQLGVFSYLILTFIPLLPSGSFFADFNANFFWINLSIFYAINKKTNIFSK